MGRKNAGKRVKRLAQWLNSLCLQITPGNDPGSGSHRAVSVSESVSPNSAAL